MKRYVIAKEYRRSSGGFSYGVFDDVEKKFVEGGFFTKAAALDSARDWNDLHERMAAHVAEVAKSAGGKS